MSEHRFLVVGERNNTTRLKESLIALGYQNADTATHNIKNVIQILENGTYDLVIADMGENSEGISLIKSLEQTEDKRRVPSILIIPEERESEIIQNGIFSYVFNFIDTEDLKRSIDIILK